jgi:glycosyltransferase involved in cell wall biosynthesis
MPSERKLRIIHTEASPHWGGQEIRIFEEMKWFREQGHEMILIAPDNGTLYQRCKDAGFDVISVYFTKPKILFNLFKMLWVLWRKKPDVIATHSSTDSWSGLSAAYLMNIKKRVRYRHVSTKVSRNFYNRIQYRTLSNLIITTANCIKVNLTQDFKLKKVFTLPTPVNVPELPNKMDSKNQLIKHLCIPKDSILIGQLSVLRSWKGHELLIDAFSELLITHENLHLVFIGDGPHLNPITSKIKRLNLQKKIHLLGHCEDVWNKIRALDFLTLASTKNEAIPQAIIQGMHSEVPVIGSNTGGIPELISHEETGLLFKSGNTNDLILCIRRLLSDNILREKLSSNAKSFIHQSYNWSQTGNLIFNQFNEN